MNALVVPCPHCSHKTRFKPERLPDGPAAFSCPGCKQKVVFDKRQLSNQQPAEAAPSPYAASPSPTESRTTAPAPPRSPDRTESPAPSTPIVLDSSAPADRRFPKLPADASFPSGIILGEDDAVVEEVRQMLSGLGSDTERVDSPEAARQLILNEQPELCVYVGGDIPAPPHDAMRALTGLPPNFRRRLFLVMIADNLSTLDGNAAFLYQVNMILARQDFPQFGAALHSGIDYHRRLYKSYFQAAERKGSI